MITSCCLFATDFYLEGICTQSSLSKLDTVHWMHINVRILLFLVFLCQNDSFVFKIRMTDSLSFQDKNCPVHGFVRPVNHHEQVCNCFGQTSLNNEHGIMCEMGKCNGSK